MKYLKFNETFSPQSGAEYTSQNYPESGVYKTPAGYIIVNKESSLAMNLGSNVTFSEYVESTQQQSNMTEAFILKALAVAQRPELIKEIV